MADPKEELRELILCMADDVDSSVVAAKRRTRRRQGALP
jgi:hypothetical protein